MKNKKRVLGRGLEALLPNLNEMNNDPSTENVEGNHELAKKNSENDILYIELQQQI